MSSKQEWLDNYETAIEDICYRLDDQQVFSNVEIDMDFARVVLDQILERNPNYLDNYSCY